MPACGEVESCESWKSDGVNSSGRRSSPILVSARQEVPRNQTTDPSHLHRAVMQEDCQDTSSPIPPCYCKAVAQSCSTTDRQSSCNVVTAAEDSQSSPVLVSSCHGVRHNKKTDSVDRTVMQEDSHRSSSPISTCRLVPQNGAAGAESYTKSSPTQAKRLDNSAIQEDGPGQCTGPSCSPGVRRGSRSSTHQQSRATHACPADQATAIRASNLMLLLSDSAYQAAVNAMLRAGVPLNKRDELDGKVIAAVKVRTIGITADEIMIDPAQAGGLLGKVDAMFADASGIEVNRSFQFSRLRPDTPLEQLFLIGRSADPVDWTNVNELDALRWLGYVSRAGFDAAVARRQ